MWIEPAQRPEGMMGEAREIMDRLTAAVFQKGISNQ
jgi:hypothetical protein